MPISPRLAHLRATRAIAVRHGKAELAETSLRELRSARLEEQIRKVVDSAPPLTADERERLASLLRPRA